MVLMQRGLAGAAIVAVGLAIAPAADAGWLGFGNGAAGQAGGQGFTLVQSPADSARIDQLAQTIRNLTGQVETLQHQLDELTQQLQKMQADNEYRFSQLEHGKGAPAAQDTAAATPPPAAAPAAPQAAPAPAADTAVADAAAAAPAADGQPPLGAPPKDLGTLILNSPPGQQPLDLSALARGDAAQGDAGGQAAAVAQPQIPPAPSGDPAIDYKAAYELFVSGQYEASEKAFRQFLEAYPGDQRAADASYWLGQTLFSRAMYREAALEFVNSHKLYPKSARAADTMLLLGKSLAGIPEREAACQTFAAALKQYPTMSNALRQRVITEQANAGC
jgi:tol-pal system protein YbgF